MPVKSPHKNIPLKKLLELQQDNFANPDTGLELSEGESVERIFQLQEARAEKALVKYLNKKQAPRVKTEEPFL